MKHINPEKPLSIEHFFKLFGQLPLTDEEAYKVKSIYYPLYEKMLENTEITPVGAWVAIKNTFIANEPQVGERINLAK